MKLPNFPLLPLFALTDNFDRAKAKANVEDTLSKYPDLAGMAGLFVYNPPIKSSHHAGSAHPGRQARQSEDHWLR